MIGSPYDDPIFEIEDENFLEERLGIWNSDILDEESEGGDGNKERGSFETGAGPDILR